MGEVGGIAPLYETAPIGGPEQDPFLNSLVILDSELEPHPLLRMLQGIEADAGRERSVRWGPRTLDLDIVATSGPPVASDELAIPHPRASEREFVLAPLVEVWPDADVGGISARSALAALDDQGVDRLRRSWVDDGDRWVGLALVAIQFLWFAAVAVAFAVGGSLPEGSPTPTRVAGPFLAFLGIVLAFTASRRFGSGLSALPEPVEDVPLIQNGPYALVRHPIYGGVVLFLGGTALFLDSVLGLLLTVGLGGFFFGKSIYEERRLRIRYAGYRDYRERVRRRLIPFLF